MIGNQRRGGVVLCRCHGQNSGSIDLETVGRFLREAFPGTPVEVADDLCRDTAPVAHLIKNVGPTCLVVGACGEGGVAARVRRRASQNGLDPYSVSLVALRERSALVHPYDQGIEKAKLLMASGLRRSLAFSGTHPCNLRPRLGGNGGMSRRSLLSLAFIQQQVIPHVETRSCLAWRGCRNCLASCPAKALFVSEERLVIDSERCRGCGLCTIACPVNALRLPTATVEEMDEAMGGLLAQRGVSLEPRLLLLTCSGTSRVLDGGAGTEYPAAVLPLELPCLGMASSFLLLRALERGAWGVGLLPCNGKCDYGFLCHLERRVEQANAVAQGLGLGERRISLVAPGEREAVVQGLKELVSYFKGAGPHRLTGIEATPLGDEGSSLGLLLYRMSQGASDGAVSLPHAEDFPLGQVAVDPSQCIACGVCAANCPTGALRAKEEAGVFRLTFSHVSCVACQLCFKVCPQRPRALTVAAGLDWGRISQPPEVLYEEMMTRCQSCGEPFTSPGVARRVQEALARRGGLFNSAYVASLCPRCRLSGGILAQSLKKNLVAAAPKNF